MSWALENKNDYNIAEFTSPSDTNLWEYYVEIPTFY